MEETPQTQTPTPSTPQPTDQQPPPQSPAPQQPLSASLPLPSSSLPPTSSSTIPSSLNPNASSPITQPLTRHPFNRPWQQPSPFQHFPSHLQSVQTPHSASSSSNSTPPEQRGGMAIGVPAPPPTSFSSLNQPSFGQQFGGLARNATNVSESVPGPSTSQIVRQPVQGIQGMGSMGSFGSGPQLRPSGIAVHHQQRPAQPSPRALTTPNNQSSASQVQNFQGHGTLRASSLGPPVSPSPSTSQGLQPHNQPWLSSGPQGKPPLPSPPFRAQMNPPSLQQRSHISQQHHHSLSTAAQQPQSSSSQPPPTTSGHQPQEHYGQQFPSSRVTQSLSHQQSTPRGPGLGNQKSSSQPVVQPSPVQSVTPNRTIVIPETGESCSRILNKRSIQELVTQIDPSLKLDPEVEDILVDIADEFVESITTFGCSLAKHRKSSTLEAKDILLHLERNWNMTLPGFSGDEIKIYRKPFASDIHKERLAAVKRSIASSETAINRNSAGQAAGSTKGHLPKAPANFIGSPNPKMREVA